MTTLFVIRRKAASWIVFDTEQTIYTPNMYYQAHLGDGYLSITANINSALMLNSNDADSVLSVCHRSRGNFEFEKVAL